MGSAKTRYIKRHYKEVKLKRELYGELKKLAEARGLSIPELIQDMLRHYQATNTKHQPTTTSTQSTPS
jgi:predicted DNA-binding ribbon-helix-helix protein